METCALQFTQTEWMVNTFISLIGPNSGPTIPLIYGKITWQLLV